VYWSADGLESVKAATVSAALLAVDGFGQPAWHAAVREGFGAKGGPKRQ
jgi:hypothetical protein